MKQRPSRPTDEFLHKIGIFYLPDDIDITFDDRTGHFDPALNMWMSPRAFHVAQVDEMGEKILATIIPAFETAARTKQTIWNDLKTTLVDQFNAVPVQSGLFTDLRPPAPRPHRPSEDFLHKVGVAVLPDNVDVTIRDNGVECGKAFIIARVGRDGRPVEVDEVPARETRAYTVNHIWNNVGRMLIQRFGAVPLLAPGE